MAVDDINKWIPSRKAGGIPWLSTSQSDSARVWRMSGLTRDGTGWPNLSRETTFSGASGDRENIIFPVQLATSRIGATLPG